MIWPKILSDRNRLSKNVKVICICEMLNDLGTSIHQPLLPVLYRILGATPFQYGMIEGLSFFLGMIWAAPSGSLSDRVGRKKIYGAGHALMGLVRPTWSLVSSFWHLLPLRWAYSLGMSIRYSARDPLLAESTIQDNVGLTYAVYEISDCIGSFAGPFVPILILAYVGQNIESIQFLFFLSAIPNIISLLLIAYYVKETVKHNRTTGMEQGLLATLRMVSGDKNLTSFMWITSIFSVFATTVEVQILYMAFGPSKAEPLLTTIMYLFWTAATLFAALPAGSVVDKAGRRVGVIVSLASYAISMIGIILHHYVIPSMFFIPVAFISLGLFESFFSVSSKTFVADNTSIEHRGATMGLYTTVTGVCRRSIAPIVSGFFFTMHSPATPFVLGLVASMISTVLLIRMTVETRAA